MSDELLDRWGRKVCESVIFYIRGEEEFEKYVEASNSPSNIVHGKLISSNAGSEDRSCHTAYTKAPPANKRGSLNTEQTGFDHREDLIKLAEAEKRFMFLKARSEGEHNNCERAIKWNLGYLQDYRTKLSLLRGAQQYMKKNGLNKVKLAASSFASEILSRQQGYSTDNEQYMTETQVERTVVQLKSKSDQVMKTTQKFLKKKAILAISLKGHDEALEQIYTSKEAIELIDQNAERISVLRTVSDIQKAVKSTISKTDLQNLVSEQEQMTAEAINTRDMLSLSIDPSYIGGELDDETLDELLVSYGFDSLSNASVGAPDIVSSTGSGYQSEKTLDDPLYTQSTAYGQRISSQASPNAVVSPPNTFEQLYDVSSFEHISKTPHTATLGQEGLESNALFG